MRVLVTGGAGYIGSHACKHLAAAGHDVVVYDNLSTGHADLVRWGMLEQGDIRDGRRLRQVFREHPIDAVMHFAAFSCVGDSVRDPGAYYANNVGGTLSLLRAMCDAKVDRMIVSSTCAVYGQPDQVPIDETAPLGPVNPYGATKLAMELMCRDFEAAHGLRTVALRYFNAAGADPEGRIGERHDPETHLIPRVFMAINGEAPEISIFGTDYDTEDGTCVRDYIHVDDLAAAHVAAVHHLAEGGASDAFNLGTGDGYSVRQVIEAARRVTNREIPVVEGARRPGDPARLFADPGKAQRALAWSATSSSLDHIIDTAWAWYQAEQRRGQ